MATRVLTPHEIAVKLIARSADVPNGCRIWLGSLTNGYGKLQSGGRNMRAHRLSYECFVGPIPDGMQIDHLCRNRSCINPVHLEAVTPRENTMRGIGPTAVNSIKTHCYKGHPLSGSNLRIRSNGDRRCHACSQVWTGNL